MVTTATVFRLVDVRFRYHATEPVIDGFSGSCRAGRVTALIGPNAAGKSTLLRLMAGLLPMDRGTIDLEGEPLEALPRGVRAGWVSYVPQQATVGFAFTVREVVAMGRYALIQDETLIESILRENDLLEIAHRPFNELSGGQQQRVILTRALAQSAAVDTRYQNKSCNGQSILDAPPATSGGRAMLLDEPVAAMDLAHAHATMQKLSEIAARGIAVIVVLHDLNLAARYADDIWLMDRGRLIMQGTWSEVLQPDILEPVYRVSIQRHERAGHDRPWFDAGMVESPPSV